MRFIAKYTLPIVAILYTLVSGLYFFQYINAILYLFLTIIIVGVPMLIRNLYMRQMSIDMLKNLAPRKYIEEIKDFLKVPSFGALKYTMYIYLSSAYIAINEYAKAKEYLDKVKTSNIFNKNPNIRYAVINNLYVVYMDTLQYDKAKGILPEFKRLTEEVSGKNPKLYDEVQESYDAKMLYYKFKTSEGEEKISYGAQYEQILDEWLIHVGENKYNRISLTFHLGELYYDMGRYDDAINEFEFVYNYGGELGAVEKSEEFIDKINRMELTSE